MTGLLDELPSRVALSLSANLKRKYAHSLEWIHLQKEAVWVGVHSARANAMAKELLSTHCLTGLPDYDNITPGQRCDWEGLTRVEFNGWSNSSLPPLWHSFSPPSEVRFGRNGASRVDFLLQHSKSNTQCHVEVKSVTLAATSERPHACSSVQAGDRLALFPDTVSTRAQRHVSELMAVARAGGQAALLFLVQRSDCVAFAPCHECDPVYAEGVVAAAAAGVRLLAAAVAFDPGAGCVRYCGQLPVLLQYQLRDGQTLRAPAALSRQKLAGAGKRPRKA
ncbi:hypothetical protein APUTEX25_001442 [Auxenochlorella protothecoides]|uniref:Sugar fermentation stimulation protein C-terminal domain-containing protein n=1 Tax=Auxenochlorella protothecoides TaxID=3075 RepID=A0A3M7KWP6_AUXPR|nr:hypothetical protein APUTEX25_001442 [Auxenochlorella protothecoides]|eukprot:RMZ54284.1 hypothetical protein APUTEX25_001442 [Auxenochlorella protothecoides]